ncbi:hypothetical protein CLV78_10919 [Aliiruegeria haliotis]|uniref:Uncharacterized protein n=1 Tax=Aliiruegeria haliotis TaxID=1280846 RepID=A0A2T0RJS3_9RHOB|nr:hypothetical protein [Aliiruegeria haliotis]PRY21408.1 hypothetical protein CLV78_10919 [Aliiruegeria haliotis]
MAMVRETGKGHQVEFYEGKSEPPVGRILGVFPHLKQARGVASREVRRRVHDLRDWAII